MACGSARAASGNQTSPAPLCCRTSFPLILTRSPGKRRDRSRQASPSAYPMGHDSKTDRDTWSFRLVPGRPMSLLPALRASMVTDVSPAYTSSGKNTREAVILPSPDTIEAEYRRVYELQLGCREWLAERTDVELSGLIWRRVPGGSYSELAYLIKELHERARSPDKRGCLFDSLWWMFVCGTVAGVPLGLLIGRALIG
jgi:hypothetical protein